MVGYPRSRNLLKIQLMIYKDGLLKRNPNLNQPKEGEENPNPHVQYIQQSKTYYYYLLHLQNIKNPSCGHDKHKISKLKCSYK